jgi:hypothetical protein
VEVDAVMWRPLRHLAYEGPRHTGRYGFKGRGVRRPDDYLGYHRGAGPGSHPHFITTAAGWEQVRMMLRPAVIAPPWHPRAAAQLLGGYDNIPVYVGECPCITNVYDTLTADRTPL